MRHNKSEKKDEVQNKVQPSEVETEPITEESRTVEDQEILDTLGDPETLRDAQDPADVDPLGGIDAPGAGDETDDEPQQLDSNSDSSDDETGGWRGEDANFGHIMEAVQKDTGTLSEAIAGLVDYQIQSLGRTVSKEQRDKFIAKYHEAMMELIGNFVGVTQGIVTMPTEDKLRIDPVFWAAFQLSLDASFAVHGEGAYENAATYFDEMARRVRALGTQEKSKGAAAGTDN